MNPNRLFFLRALRRLRWIWFGVLLSFPPMGQSQPPNLLQSRLQEIYEKHEYDARSFGPVRWLTRGDGYVLFEPSARTDGLDLVRYEPKSDRREVLIAAAQLRQANGPTRLDIDKYALYPGPIFALSPDAARALVAANIHASSRITVADYWLLECKTGALRQVATEVEDPDMEGVFSPDGLRIAYVRAHNIYVQDVKNGSVIQITADGVVGSVGNGVSDWGSGIVRWSPDSAQIAYTRTDSSEVGLFPLLDNTKAVYPKPDYIRFPKVGTPIPSQRLGIVNASGGATRWIDIPSEARGHYLEGISWVENSRELVVQKLARSRDRLEVFAVDAGTGKAKLIHHEQDSAWIQDRFASNTGFHWIQRSKAFTWLKEENGWRHAYAISRGGDRQTRLTRGDYDVITNVATDQKRGWLYYMASPQNATQAYLYRARFDGSGRAERVTPHGQSGTHSYNISPDARWAIHTYSTADTPPVTDLVELPSHRTAKVLEDNAQLRERMAAWRARPTEFLHLDIGGGVVMDAWMLKPRDFDASKKYPILVFVYGEPASQTVVDSWSIGQRKQLFHRAIADTGYLVISIDNRGTPAPKGSAWRRAVFGSLGLLSTEEQAAGLRELGRTRPYVDLSRVGIWGWSAGGTNTLNALFRKPDQYHVGIAVAPKPRADLYNAWFQEAFMRTPDVNREGYRLAAPLNYAEGLKGNLLIIHGTGDDNSHLQITEHLVNRLIELGKPFDYMTYPNRTHSINEGPGTTLHLHSLIARYLTERLPAGPRDRDSEATGRE